MDEKRETVVVDNGRRGSGGLIALAIVIGLLILFFLFGGMNLFNGDAGETNTGGETNVEVQTPDVQAPTEGTDTPAPGGTDTTQ